MRSVLAVLKWVVGIGLVLGLIVGGAGVFLFPHVKKMIEESKAGRAGLEVRTQHVERGRLVRTISAPGVVEPRTKVNISARVSATIVELAFREGDEVTAGAVVVRLNDRDLRAALDSAEASMRADEARLEGARASFVNATAEWERQKSLYGTNDVSRAAMEAAEADLRRAESNLRAAEHAIGVARAHVDQARENLAYATITSPISGRVTKLNAEVGELVVTGTMNNAGTVILSVGDLTTMLVITQIGETDVAKVKPGQTARVYLAAYPDEVFEGTVERVALQETLSMADRSKFYETEIVLHLPEGRTMLSGLAANVDVEIETAEGVLLTPSQAVLDMRVDELPAELDKSEQVDHDKTFARVIYMYKDGKAIATPVKIGSSDLTRTALVAGVPEGAEIITGPWSALQKLKHELAVRRIEKSAGEKKDEAPAVAAEGDKAATSEDAGAKAADSGDAQAQGDAQNQGQSQQQGQQTGDAAAQKETAPASTDGGASGRSSAETTTAKASST